MPDYPRDAWSDVPARFALMGTADGVAIHHTASVPQGLAYDPAYLRSIEHGEIAAGYDALAYHTMWFDNGESAESRPYGTQGAATGGHNHHTIAHCAIGYFHPPYNHIPSDRMCRDIAAEIYQTRVDGWLTWDAPVLPHTVWTAGTQWATACCGETFIPRVAEIDTWSRAAGPGVPPGPIPPPPQSLTTEDPMVVVIDSAGTLYCYVIGTDDAVHVNVKGNNAAFNDHWYHLGGRVRDSATRD